ncbi:putative ribulose-bisphosphate carboxylase [Lupinus albus]|uniref:Putative ribulose-bisphosphate carboxylase n=1 Tax=Lupinus albus TaxID=3870 RepID=A0A6A4QQW3_LUPAL|nr:putative ribulose-bisphosphate carboxylase [Lupinus albus]
MVSSMISSQAVNIINRASPVQASMVAPFTGLKSIVGFPITWKANNAITTINFVHDNNNGWVPCLEFELENHKSPGYYDGRYWTMWKLPMFGCTASARVLKEVEENGDLLSQSLSLFPVSAN